VGVSWRRAVVLFFSLADLATKYITKKKKKEEEYKRVLHRLPLKSGRKEKQSKGS